MQLNPGSNVMMPRHLCAVLSLLTLLLSLPALAQDRSVRSSLSSTTITRDESVTLTIVARGLDAELDASSLTQNFDVVGRSSSRELSSINNSPPTSVVTWALELIPRDIGVFTVPAVMVGDLSTQIHTLTVNDTPTGAQRDIFIEASVDTQSPWVQSQVLMTLRVFQAIDIVDGGLDVPSGSDLVVERIGEDTRSTAARDGRQYSVTERRFALFPQKSGPIVIEPITLSVSVPAQSDGVRGFFSPTRKLIRRTDRITLNVQSRPDSGTAWWLPARSVQLESQWVGDVANATVDQPLTRRVRMRASGVADTQLPDISIPAIDGVSLYAEQPERAMNADNQGLLAEQVITWALIPQRAGVLEIPAVNVDWFNTVSGEMETAMLPAETITVSAAASRGGASSNEGAGAGAGQPVIPPTDNIPPTDLLQSGTAGLGQSASGSELQQVSDPLTGALDEQNESGRRMDALETSVANWRSAAIALAVMCLLMVLVYVLRLRRTGKSDADTDGSRLDARLGAVRQVGADSLQRIKPMAEISASAKTGDLVGLRQALLDWSARQWPDDSPLTLDALAQRLPDSEARLTLTTINAAFYSRGASTSPSELLNEKLTELPDQLAQALRSHDNVIVSARTESNSAGNGLPSL